MKIVFIIDSLRRHGTQRFLAHLTRGLHDLGYEESVIALNNVCDPEIERELRSAGCQIHGIGKIALFLGGIGWWRLVGILKRTKPGVVMTMLDYADTLGRPAAKLARCSTIISSIRVRNVSKPLWRRWLDRKTIAWAKKVVFNSQHVADHARAHDGVKADQIVFIPNGVEDLRAGGGASRDVCRAQLSVSPDTTLIGAVGRLHRQKNFPLLLRAAAKLSTERQWKILLIGDGPEKRRLHSLSRELGLVDRVTWLGARSDVEVWLSAMDIFVHTADFEGMPNAVMEAMAAGLPVVASAVDGNRELIRDNVNGYLVSPGDVETFAKRIDALMADSVCARRLGDAAHHDVLEKFSMSRMIDNYHRLFISLTEPDAA